MFKLTSLNLNGIRSAATKGVIPWIETTRPDCICVQEIKAQQADMLDKFEVIDEMNGYFQFAEKKGYSGVGIYTRHAPSDVVVGYGCNEFDPEGRVIVFDQGVPWKDHLYTLEEEKGEPGTLYVLYPEKQGDPASKWRVQCVPETSESFTSRKPLPEAWRGFRDEELDGISGVPGCVFVHAAGFIGGNKTYDGVMEMTKKALA